MQLDGDFYCGANENGVLSISPKHGGTSFIVLGASLPLGTDHRGCEFQQLMVSVPSGKETPSEEDVIGLIAMVVRTDNSGRKKSDEFNPFLVPIIWREAKLYIDLEDPNFLPGTSGRLGQVIDLGPSGWCLEVKVFQDIQDGENSGEEMIFTTDPNHVPGQYYVPDGDLLCRFLVGQAEIKKLQETADHVEAEASAQDKLAELGRFIRQETRKWTVYSADGLADGLTGDESIPDVFNLATAMFTEFREDHLRLKSEIRTCQDCLASLRSKLKSLLAKSHKWSARLSGAFTEPGLWARHLKEEVKAVLGEMAQVEETQDKQ